MQAKNRIEITIIYGFRNREIERVRRSLNSLKEQSNHNFKVIFVDYGSEEKVSALVKQLVVQYNFCTYVYNETRGMPWNRAHALNTGIKMATSELVFTADIDLIFTENFVLRATKLAKANTVLFFPVVYLTKEIDFSNISRYTDLKVSDQNARGLALLNLQDLKKIRGFDEFYCFWGHEDNDLELRLRLLGCESVFLDTERLLYHQWHTPMRKTKQEIPKRWLTFQSDYLKYNQTVILRNSKDWGKLYDFKERPALINLYDQSTKWEEIDYKPEFLRYRLQKWFAQAKSSDSLVLQWQNPATEQYDKSSATKYASILQRMFDISRIPFSVKNSYSSLFPTISDVRDTFAYFIREHKLAISDFAEERTLKSIKMVVIK